MFKQAIIAGGITVLTLTTVLEFFAPKLVKTPHLVYKEWGNRPLTFYPNTVHRQVTPEADVFFRTNRFGFKDVDHQIEKKTGVYRILLLGDSFVEGLSVPVSKQISKKMEEIASLKGFKIEVISMAMSGWGQAQHLSTYMRLGRKFHPDLVISFFCSNDLWNNESIPDFRMEDGKLFLSLPQTEIGESIKNKTFRATLGNLEAYFVLKALIQNLYIRLWVSTDEISAAKIASSGEFPLNAKNGAFESEDEKLERLVGSQFRRQLFVGLIRNMKREVVETDGVEWINTIVSADVRKDQPDFNWYMDWVEKSFSQIGVRTINFHRLFRERYLKFGDIPHFSSDVHWNEKGHEWVAEKLVNQILVKN